MSMNTRTILIVEDWPRARAAEVAMAQSYARASLAIAEPLAAVTGEIGDAFDIQWMPPGRQFLIGTIDDEPTEMDFTVTARHAEICNRQLQDLRARAAAGEGDVPYFDFNHDDDKRSGEPEELYWAGDHPRLGGIRARGKWSGSGKQSLVNRDYRRFSPEWIPDKKRGGEPIGVGVNLGGLVNRAAFRKIQPVVAKDAGGRKNNNTNGDTDMTREEFKALLDEGLKPITERITNLETASRATAKDPAGNGAAAAQPGALTEAKITQLVQSAVETAIRPINEREASHAKARAKSAVQAHVGRGAIAPEDADTIGFYEKNYLADADGTEKAMAKLPGRRFQPVTPGAAGTVTGSTGPDQEIRAAAKETQKRNPNLKSETEAVEAHLCTPQGNAAYQAYRSQLLSGASGLPTRMVNK